MVQQGDNVVGVQLGSGWYSQEQYRDGTDQPSYGPPRMIFQMAIEYTDGSTDTVLSDDQSGWVGRQGANMHDGVYMGSVYDARSERADWSTASFNDPTTLWLPATIVPSPLDATGQLSLQPMDPIRLPPDNLHIATSARFHPGQRGSPADVSGVDLALSSGGLITPVSVGSNEGQLFDLGQNMAGWCAIKASGRRGMAVHIRYSETLTEPNAETNHGLYVENLRQAASTDMYIFKSDDTPEIIEPQFTVHGFRYIEIQGAKNGIAASDIQCMAVHSETTLKGNFTTNNVVMNQIQHNIQWGQLSNLMSLPSDCPQRDERKGWMGDAGLTVDEALFNFDLAPFYHNFLQLIADDQAPNGGVSDTVPHTYGANPSDPNWGTAFPTIAWTLYEHYGDIKPIQKHLANITAYVEQLRGDYKGTGLKNLRYEYGDWVPPPPQTQTNSHLIASFPFMRDVMTLSKMYSLVNETAIARQYASFYTSLCTEFNAAFYTNDTIGYADGKQTANALALALPGLVPANKVKTVVAALVNDIKAHDTTITVGIVGTAQLWPVLSANGQHDLALTLAQSIKYPSHGYMSFNPVENATTLWELWNSPTGQPEMDSRNHIMFGSIGAWFYRDVAGINPNGLEMIQIRPRMSRDVSLSPEIHAEVVTVKGLISVDYVRDAASQSITMKVTVPANAQAKLSLEPLSASGKCATIHEGHKLIYQSTKSSMYSRSSENVESVEGIQMIERDPLDGTMHLQIESGSYEFTAVWA
jgi:alpha-L-rhamnosidase